LRCFIDFILADYAADFFAIFHFAFRDTISEIIWEWILRFLFIPYLFLDTFLLSITEYVS
jgi:hypothetical protein